MHETMLATLSDIRTVDDMIVAFRNEDHCRQLLESMVWPDGRICPACGYKRSIAIAGRDMGKRRARPGLYQCSSREYVRGAIHVNSARSPASFITSARSMPTSISMR